MTAPGRPSTELVPRPRPLADEAGVVARYVGVAGALATALVGWGILSAEQSDAVVGLLGAIPGVVTLVTAALAAFHVVRRAEPLVTPLVDPRDDKLRPLVAETPNGVEQPYRRS